MWYRLSVGHKNNFKIGCSQFMKHHKKNYDKDWKKKTKIDISDMFGKGKKKDDFIVIISYNKLIIRIYS